MRYKAVNKQLITNANAKFKRYSAVFKAQVMEKEQHTAHCKTAEILKFYTLKNSWMASDEWENE